jgi:hypothetical protein
MTDDFETIEIDVAEPSYGIQMGIQGLRVHPRRVCMLRDLPCVIHSPSDHSMRDWPLNWRSDTGVMERFCPHGVGHPDPDHMAYVRSLTPEHDCVREMIREMGQRPTKDPLAKGFYLSEDEDCPYPHLEWQGVHGCDGCCIA